MHIKILSAIISLWFIFVPCNRLMAKQDSTLILITYPFAKMPKNLTDDIESAAIRELANRLPEDLETAILDISKEEISFLSRKKLITLKETLDYENREKMVNQILTTVSEPFDAILFTEIARSIGRIGIKAEIVDRSTKIMVKRSVEFQTTILVQPDSLDSQINNLAYKLVNTLTEKQAYLYKYMGLDQRPFLNYPTLSSGTIMAGATIWYLFENAHINDLSKKYDSATGLNDVTNYRIQIEESKTRRGIAKTTALLSGVLFGAFMIRDIFFRHQEVVQYAELENSLREKSHRGLKLQIKNSALSEDSISLSMVLLF